MIPDDTIAAIATPPGQGAVALLRLSGPDAIRIASGIFRAKHPLHAAPPRMAILGTLCDAAGENVDQVLATVFPAPGSYTGENVVEIACHGGILVTRKILDVLLTAGARMAAPGEFTQRAFLNGKMDLTQAEAVMDLISAQTTLALRAAQEQLQGSLGARIALTQSAVLEVLAHVEAHIDFPEENIDPATGAALRAKMENVSELIGTLLDTADQGRILREGVRTVICGVPNAGKSSLLNLLLGFDRAIVSEHPGTTRDTIEEVINLRGLPLRIVDTAGLRHTEDAVEKQGVARTAQQLELAELILEVVDASQPRGPRIALPPGATDKRILVLNKADLGAHPEWQAELLKENCAAISCKTGAGRDELAEKIFRLLSAGNTWSGHLVAINARHQNCLQRASCHLGNALQAFSDAASAEFVAVDLRAALEALGEIVGRLDVEDLLGEIFSKFCIGK